MRVTRPATYASFSLEVHADLVDDATIDAEMLVRVYALGFRASLSDETIREAKARATIVAAANPAADVHDVELRVGGDVRYFSFEEFDRWLAGAR